MADGRGGRLVGRRATQGGGYTIFAIHDLHYTYTGPKAIEALRGIDLTIAAGEYVAIVGANGSGKSTLARHLNGLLLPGQGSVHVMGDDTREAALLPAIRQAVQMVFQQPDSQLVATVVEEDVAFGPENFGVPQAELAERVRSALETVGMWDLRSRPPHMLSSGQKQRVAIAGALAVRPQALVLDEATAMLDAAGRMAVLSVLRLLHERGTTVLTITHEMEEAAEAGRVIVLERGRIAMDGTPHAVFARAAELRRLSLDVPAVAELALRWGLPVCLTPDELLATLAARGPQPFQAAARATAPPAPRPRASGPIVEVRDLEYTYLRGTPLSAEALRGVDFSADRGEVVGLIGETGSGKSTLMQHLNGLLRPQAGHVVIAGQDLASPGADVRGIRRIVGLLFQQPEDQLFERYVGDDVAFGPRQMGLDRQEIRRRVRTAMDMVGLGFEEFKDRPTQTLSGGEQRRAALAGVLALEPQVLVVDEPTSGLDPRGRVEVLNIFRQANGAGTTLIMASHRLDDIAALSDRVVALRGGRVAAAGPARAVLGQPDLLASAGLPVAPLTALAARLRAGGWPVPEGALTVDEIAAAVHG